MTSLKPETGLVFRYDFVFRDERVRGIDSGKERPCAIIVATEPNENGARNILAAPITHTPPVNVRDGVEIPPRLARHLGLDDDRMWVKTNELNRFTWEENQIPLGVVPASRERPAYGVLPDRFHRQVTDAIREQSNEKSLSITGRDEVLDRYHRLSERSQSDGRQAEKDHDQADED